MPLSMHQLFSHLCPYIIPGIIEIASLPAFGPVRSWLRFRPLMQALHVLQVDALTLLVWVISCCTVRGSCP